MGEGNLALSRVSQLSHVPVSRYGFFLDSALCPRLFFVRPLSGGCPVDVRDPLRTCKLLLLLELDNFPPLFTKKLFRLLIADS